MTRYLVAAAAGACLGLATLAAAVWIVLGYFDTDIAA